MRVAGPPRLRDNAPEGAIAEVNDRGNERSRNGRSEGRRVSNSNVLENLTRLRTRMASEGVAAYVVPSGDPHQSEYVPVRWQRRARLSGFTGSAGLLVVLADGARLWTDSRYWLQATRELPAGAIDLMRQGAPDVPEPAAWLASALRSGERVGVDPQTFTEGQWTAWQRHLQPAGVELLATPQNWVDLEAAPLPPLPRNPLRSLGAEFTGRATREKLGHLRAALEQARCTAHVISALDSIAWLFNVRGSDVPHNPVAVSYAIVTRENAQLFIDPAKVTAEVQAHLGDAVRVRPYEAFAEALGELARSEPRIWVDPDATSRWITAHLRGGSAVLHEAESPVLLAKAIKNDVELAGMRACHVRDGAALVRFLRWLEDAAASQPLDEISVADRLDALRADGEHFQGTSFSTISAYGPNAALPHYRAEPGTCAKLERSGMYLVDSGAQYLDGTTDVTRTLALGPVRDAERRAFTLVLRGHIAVATAHFPEGTTGAQIDALARRPLWDDGLDYGHGTGHGVGHFLCVHEGPQRIAQRSLVPLQVGMILSNEPGYYESGAFGIRIENLVEVVERGKGRDGRRFLGFDDLTLCPIDTRCIEPSLLAKAERDWLNGYHERVQSTVGPLLDSADRTWLTSRTRPL
jgi:Xaa-Pro aminopeptidase